MHDLAAEDLDGDDIPRNERASSEDRSKPTVGHVLLEFVLSDEFSDNWRVAQGVGECCPHVNSRVAFPAHVYP